MGITERREREKEALRTRIVEAARDIISEKGLDALSMRSIADRIEYSPGTIYLYFKDKSELLGEVIHAGFELMEEYVAAELRASGAPSTPAEHHRALGRAYARFGLENTAYFRVMFELPSVPQAIHLDDCEVHSASRRDSLLVDTIQAAIDAGQYQIRSAEVGALVAWGLLHGITSLYLSGHLAGAVPSHEAFLELVEVSMDSLGSGWKPRETSGSEVS